MAAKHDQLGRVRQEPLPHHALRIWLRRVAGIIVAIPAGMIGALDGAVATKTAPLKKRPGQVGGGPSWQDFQAVPPAQSRWIRILDSAISR